MKCPPIASYSSWHSAASRYRRSSRERTSYLDCICHRSFRRTSFCSGDEGGAFEHLIKPSKARTGCCRKTRSYARARVKSRRGTLSDGERIQAARAGAFTEPTIVDGSNDPITI